MLCFHVGFILVPSCSVLESKIALGGAHEGSKKGAANKNAEESDTITQNALKCKTDIVRLVVFLIMVLKLFPHHVRDVFKMFFPNGSWLDFV